MRRELERRWHEEEVRDYCDSRLNIRARMNETVSRSPSQPNYGDEFTIGKSETVMLGFVAAGK